MLWSSGDTVSLDVQQGGKRYRVLGVVTSSNEKKCKVCVQTKANPIVLQVHSADLHRATDTSWKSSDKVDCFTIAPTAASARVRSDKQSATTIQQKHHVDTSTKDVLALRRCLLDPFDVITEWREPALSWTFLLCCVLTSCCRHWEAFLQVPLIPLFIGSADRVADFLFTVAIILVLVAGTHGSLEVETTKRTCWRSFWVIAVVVLTAATVVQWRWGNFAWFLQFNLSETIFFVTGVTTFIRKWMK